MYLSIHLSDLSSVLHPVTPSLGDCTHLVKRTCCVPGQWPQRQPSLRLRTARTSRVPARADARAYTYHSDREPGSMPCGLCIALITLSSLQRRGQRHLQSGAAGARAVLARGVTAAHPASRRCPCRCPCAAEVDARAVRAPSVTWLSPLPGGPCAAEVEARALRGRQLTSPSPADARAPSRSPTAPLLRSVMPWRAPSWRALSWRAPSWRAPSWRAPRAPPPASVPTLARGPRPLAPLAVSPLTPPGRAARRRAPPSTADPGCADRVPPGPAPTATPP